MFQAEIFKKTSKSKTRDLALPLAQTTQPKLHSSTLGIWNFENHPTKTAYKNETNCMHKFRHCQNQKPRISLSPTIKLCPKRITGIGKNKPMYVAETITFLESGFLQT